MKVPQYLELFNPVLLALHALGGSGSVEEIYSKVIEQQNYSADVVNATRGNRQTALEYNLAWARTYLKNYGLIENTARGIWSIASGKLGITEVDAKAVVNYVLSMPKKIKDSSAEDIPINESIKWQEELLEILLSISPEAFERLTQRILRESGFSQVEVTGKTGDGGIDGRGLFKVAKLISFRVFFQCKRWQKSVSASDIRDFRGALQGRADKGLFVTTGNFTRDAMKEASRDGAPPIDLIDGEMLTDIIKELNLGLLIEIEQVEKITINKNWFLQI